MKDSQALAGRAATAAPHESGGDPTVPGPAAPEAEGDHRVPTGLAHLRVVMDAIPALVALLDADGRYAFVNRAYAEWFGLSEHALLGRRARDVLGEDTWAAVAPRFRQALAGEGVGFELQVPFPSRGSRWMQVTYTPNLSPAGAVDGVVVLLHDVTEKKQTEEALAFLAAATTVLGGTLDWRACVTRLARLSVPALADWCIVHARDDAGAWFSEAAGGPGVAEGALRQLAAFEAARREGASHAVQAVLTSGRSILQSTVTPADLARSVPSPEHLAATALVGVGSFMAVPLVAGDRVLGVACWGARAPGRLGPSLLAVAEELGRRAGLAVRNAQLHEEVQAAKAQVESERSRLLRIFDQAPIPISIRRGPEQVFELVNAAYATLSDRGDLVGRRFAEALPGSAAILEPVIARILETREPATFREYEGRVRGDPEPRFWDIAWHPIEGSEGEVEGLITMSFEVTEQVRARRRVEELAKRLEEAVRSRDELLSAAAHELKNPLHALRLQVASVLRASQRTGEPPPVEWMYDRVVKADTQIARLTRLVDELLDVSRITAGRLSLDLEPVDLSEVVRELAERKRDAGLSEAIVVETPGPVVGRWDRLRVEQLATNLLSNAVKYGEGRPVAVTVTREGEGEGGVARLVVRDEGLGIPAAEQARIFERFERAVSGRQYGGFGLGLWITRQVAHALGGDISVISAPGEGSTFTVTLPLAGPAQDPGGHG